MMAALHAFRIRAKNRKVIVGNYIEEIPQAQEKMPLIGAEYDGWAAYLLQIL
jgi:hypothetical protein